ncbi:MAG: non-canonical purine NTP pyrophosphatase [Thermoplasmata archaeon]
MPAVTFVSTNPGKYREVRALLRPYGIRVRWKRRTLPEPQTAKIEEVVRSKLDAVRDVPGWVLVEDSGLFIPSLNDFPGMYSAHILDIWGFGPLLELLKSRPRAASFRAVAGLRRGRKIWLFPGEVRGKIAPRAAGKNGFGYDPIFIPEGGTRTFAQIPSAEKNDLSHRSQALRAAGRMLASLDARGRTHTPRRSKGAA